MAMTTTVIMIFSRWILNPKLVLLMIMMMSTIAVTRKTILMMRMMNLKMSLKVVDNR